MQFKAEVPVSSEAVMYAFLGVIEQGYDWFHKFHPLDAPPSMEPWYADKTFFENDFKIEVTYDDPDKEEGNGSGSKWVGPEEVQRGLTLMAERAPDDLADLVSESSADANTYDVFMQYVVLGEVVYG